MKKICGKILACIVLALLAVTTVSSYVPVDASSTSLLTYAEYNISFKGRRTVAHDVTGMFMDVKVKATASNNNNETITMNVYIVDRNTTKSYTFLSDGQDHTYKNIYLGLSGGSSVRFEFIGANPEITINTTLTIGS